MSDHISAAIEAARSGDLDTALAELLAAHKAGESDERLLELTEAMMAAQKREDGKKAREK